MNVQEALAAMGVTADTLIQAEKDQLDRDGYLPLPNILSAEQLAQIRKRTDELIAAEGDAAGKEVHQEAGATRLSDLVNKDPIFEVCFTHPRVLAAINHVLRARCIPISRGATRSSSLTRKRTSALKRMNGSARRSALFWTFSRGRFQGITTKTTPRPGAAWPWGRFCR